MIGLAVLGARMRWAITRNSLRKRGLPLFVLSLVFAAIMAIGGFALLAGSRAMKPGIRETTIVFVCTVVAIAWAFGPLLIGGADETVDPTRLALLPLEGPRLAAVMTGAAISTPATMALGIALLGGVVAGWSGPLGGLVSLLAVAALFVFGLGMARTIAAAMGLANRTRRGRDLSVLVAALAGVVLWLASQSIGPIVEASNTAHGKGVIRVMNRLPPGWAAQALLLAHDGAPLRALPRIAAVAALGVLLLWSWARLTSRLLVGSERAAPATTTGHDRRVWPNATDARGAALAKEWRYQWRAPTKRTQLLIGTIMATGFALLQSFNARRAGPEFVFIGLSGMLFCTNAAFNVIGFDSAAMWLDVLAAGGVGRTQLRARLLAALPSVVAPPVVAIGAVAAVRSGWSRVPLAMACVPSATLCMLGVGAVLSAKSPLAVLDGDNPFRRPANASGCGYGINVLLAVALVGVLGAPMLVPAILSQGRWWGWIVALLGLCWGWGVWQLGLGIGSRALQRRGPDLLHELAYRAAA